MTPEQKAYLEGYTVGFRAAQVEAKLIGYREGRESAVEDLWALHEHFSSCWRILADMKVSLKEKEGAL